MAGVVTPAGVPERTDLWPLERASRMVSPMEVSIKRTADQEVSLVRMLAAPRGPKAVCEPCPPKAPATSADLPCCRRTTPIKNKQTMTCTMTRRMSMKALRAGGAAWGVLDWCGGGDLNPYALRR